MGKKRQLIVLASNFGRAIGLAHVKELANGKQNVGPGHDRHNPHVRCSGSGDAYQVGGLGSGSREEVAFFQAVLLFEQTVRIYCCSIAPLPNPNPYLPSSPARRAGLFASTNETKEHGILWTLTMRPGSEGRQRSAGKSRVKLAT
jgi:hypothetical protein